jgi:hypothetical protein
MLTAREIRQAWIDHDAASSLNASASLSPELAAPPRKIPRAFGSSLGQMKDVKPGQFENAALTHIPNPCSLFVTFNRMCSVIKDIMHL